MAKTDTMSEKLIAELMENYMEKIFYFCLKKTGNHTEAEDLTQDIALNILVALNKGTVPESFSAWVWRIARNRYSRWADSKHRNTELVTGDDIGDYEIADERENALDKMIHSEQLALLRRELAFIGSEYREIIVAYYIEDRSVRDIAAFLSLSQAAVKQRLYRARNILKEGMNMAREFGPKSYKPENVRFVANGNQPSGLPWSAVERSVQKNILLEAADNPSTVEDLAIALGIAAPYMQDELDILVKATLLKKVGDKYITNIPFVSKEAQERAHKLKIAIANEMADTIDKIAEDAIPKIRKLGAVKNDKITDADIKWWAVCYCAFLSEGNWENPHEYATRENGETWEFYGFEEVDFYDGFVSFNGNGFLGYDGFSVFVPHDFHLAEGWTNFGPAHAVVLVCEAIKSGRKYNELSETEKSQFDTAYRIAHTEEDGSITPDILCFNKVSPKSIFKEHPLFNKLVEFDKKLYTDIVEILKSEQNSYVQNQVYGVAGTMNHMRGLVVRREVELGRLTVPEDPWNNTCTASLWIN